MSVNDTRRIGEIRSAIQTENEKKHRLPDVRVIIMAACILMLLMLILFLGLVQYYNTRTPAGAFRYGKDTSVSYDLPGSDGDTVIRSRDGLAAVTDSGFLLLNGKGETLGSVRRVFNDPKLCVGSRLSVVCELGGSRIAALDHRGRTVMDQLTEGTLLDMDVSDGDTICIAELQTGYKAVLTVYDNRQNQIYRWYSGSRYMNQCAVSEDAELLCAIALEEENARFRSTAVLFETDVEVPVAELSLGDQLIRDVYFLDKNVICAVGETALLIFSDEGELLSGYDYTGQKLQDYSAEGDGFTALVLNKYQAGSQASVVTVDESGNVLGEVQPGEEVLSVTAAGPYCAVRTPGTLYVYDKELNLCAKQSASGAVLYPNGSVILLEDGIGTRYLPE